MQEDERFEQNAEDGQSLADKPLVRNQISRAGRIGLMHEELTKTILAACFEVAAEIGVGFLESVYEKSLVLALHDRGIESIRQYPINVFFRGECVGNFYADLFVEGKVIVELKASCALAPEHLAQTINYLNATGIDVGLLVNFGTARIQYRRLCRNGKEKGDTRNSTSSLFI